MGSKYQFNFISTPQFYMQNREIENHAGRLLGGSSSVNYGLWTRGHSADYDAWADLVGDKRWSYHSPLPYFKQVETHYDRSADPEKYGFTGPVSTVAGKRTYPLYQVVHDAFVQSGLVANLEANGGNPIGITAFTENWKDGQRQPASKAFDLSKVDIFVKSTVARIEIEPVTNRTQRVHLEDGRSFTASKEILIYCGALKTPQLLMLSGIGPAAELARHNLPYIADLPVGANLHDHLAVTIF